ncbi:MAG: arginine repressor [Myxococcales bacterium]|nr:arginine repressor [Myxococcales bacterium]
MTATRSRRDALRELLSGGRASTQAELCALLAARGHEVTQSTVSRDLKRLGAERTVAADGVPVYRLTGAAPARLGAGVVLGVSHNEQLVVLRTPAGLAGAVGLEIDALGHPDVLGTVAGDDTVLVVPRTTTRVGELASALRAFGQLGPPPR